MQHTRQGKFCGLKRHEVERDSPFGLVTPQVGDRLAAVQARESCV